MLVQEKLYTPKSLENGVILEYHKHVRTTNPYNTHTHTHTENT